MEFIDGLPLDRYCEQHRLAVEERLRLVRQVCGAVSFAHRNLVIHRDIKPGNILVDDEGTAKLLDLASPACWSLPRTTRVPPPSHAYLLRSMPVPSSFGANG
jgi:serine/threonine protein kinase